MNAIGRQSTGGSSRWGIVAALVLALGAGGCDRLLEVDLPAAVTSDALDNPIYAPVLVNAVMAQFECAYSSFVMDAAGMEDNFQMVTGVAGNYSQYWQTAGGGQCDGDAYSQEWEDPLLIARGQGYTNHASMKGWGSSQTLIGTNAFYVAATLDVFGEHYCEFAIDGGPLLSPDATLAVAEGWIDTVFAAVTAAGGDFAITTTAGTQTSSIMTAAYGLRARIRWARGNLAGAAADAALVPTGHRTLVLREDGEKRRNMPSVHQSGGGGIQASGFLQGPVKIKTASDSYGVTQLGSHPNGTAWTSPLPFTGYLNLGIDNLTGRAVSDTGVPVLQTDVGAVDDTRVTHIVANTAGGLDNIPQKYPNPTDDIPLINWKEMRLIQAQAAGPGAAATALVNEVRTADGLPLIAGTYQSLVESDANRFRDMIIEERRRALFEEGRFWSTKIKNNTLLWFPRAVGDLINAGASYTFGGGVRLLMGSDEYQINTNFANAGGLALRATGCDPFEAPNGF